MAVDGRIEVELVTRRKLVFLFSEIKLWRIVQVACEHQAKDAPFILQIMYEDGYEAIPWNKILTYKVYFNSRPEENANGSLRSVKL